jgi:hypothetical protein
MQIQVCIILELYPIINNFQKILGFSSLPENKQNNPPFLQKLKNVFSCKGVDVAPYEEKKGGRGGGI